MAEFKALLLRSGVGTGSQWRKVQAQLADQEASLALDKIDRLAVFEEVVRAAEAQEEQERQRELLLERLAGSPDVMRNGWLLDGFPRTLAQAEAIISDPQWAQLRPDAVVCLHRPPELLKEFALGRWRSQRKPPAAPSEHTAPAARPVALKAPAAPTGPGARPGQRGRVR